VRFKSGINESDLPSSPREKGVNPALPSSPREKGVNPELMSSSSLLLREKGVNTEFTNFFFNTVYTVLPTDSVSSVSLRKI